MCVQMWDLMVSIFLSWFTTVFCVCVCVIYTCVWLCYAHVNVCKHTHVNKKCRPDVKVEGHFLFIFSTFLLILCVGVSKLVPHVYMVRSQPVATGSLLPPCGAWGSHSDPKTWCQVPCSAESSCQPSYFLETGSRTEPGLHRPSGQHTPEILLSQLP